MVAKTLNIHVLVGLESKESEVAQSCPTLCDPMDCSLPGSSLHGILQARVLEWVAISFPGDLPDPGIEPGSPTVQADAVTSEPPGKPREQQEKAQVSKRTNKGENKARINGSS